MAICSIFWIIICHNWNQWLEMKKWLNIIKYLSVLPFCQSSCCHLEKARNINYEKAIFVLLYWWFQKEGNRWTMQQGKGDRSIADGEGLKGRWVFLLSLCGGMFLKFNLFFYNHSHRNHEFSMTANKYYYDNGLLLVNCI